MFCIFVFCVRYMYLYLHYLSSRSILSLCRTQTALAEIDAFFVDHAHARAVLTGAIAPTVPPSSAAAAAMIGATGATTMIGATETATIIGATGGIETTTTAAMIAATGGIETPATGTISSADAQNLSGVDKEMNNTSDTGKKNVVDRAASTRGGPDTTADGGPDLDADGGLRAFQAHMLAFARQHPGRYVMIFFLLYFPSSGVS
jgi:hypothetical protein